MFRVVVLSCFTSIGQYWIRIVLDSTGSNGSIPGRSFIPPDPAPVLELFLSILIPVVVIVKELYHVTAFAKNTSRAVVYAAWYEDWPEKFDFRISRLKSHDFSEVSNSIRSRRLDKIF